MDSWLKNGKMNGFLNAKMLDGWVGGWMGGSGLGDLASRKAW